MNLRQAAEMALEYLTYGPCAHYVISQEMISTLREALAQPEQKPVAFVIRNASGQIHMTDHDGNSFDMSKFVGQCLYTHPATIPEGWQQFNEWMHNEMPSGTIIGDAGWWASRIYKRFIAAPKPEE